MDAPSEARSEAVEDAMAPIAVEGARPALIAPLAVPRLPSPLPRVVADISTPSHGWSALAIPKAGVSLLVHTPVGASDAVGLRVWTARAVGRPELAVWLFDEHANPLIVPAADERCREDERPASSGSTCSVHLNGTPFDGSGQHVLRIVLMPRTSRDTVADVAFSLYRRGG